MPIIVTNITQCGQIAFRISAAFDVGFDMVQFKVSRVGRVPMVMSPTALGATVAVANQHGATYRVGDFAVVHRALPILFKNVNADGKVWAAC
jgi:hypothetical protein